MAGQAIADAGTRHRQSARRRPRTIAHGLGRCSTALTGLAVYFDPESARQQSVGGRQQGVGTGRQAGNACANGYLAPNRRVPRRIPGLHAGYDGVDRIAGNIRQGKTAIGVVLHQRVETRIGRAATARDEASASQLTTTGYVNHRALSYRHRLTAQFDPARHSGIACRAAQQALIQGNTVILVGDAIHRTTVRHDQPAATDRSQAAAQQVNLRGSIRGQGPSSVTPQNQFPERGPQHSTLIDQIGVDGQATKCRIRHLRRCRATARNINTSGVDRYLGVGRGINLGGDKRQGGGRVQSGETGRTSVSQEAQVTFAAQAHLFETSAVHGQTACLLSDGAADAEVKLVADIH